MKSCTDENERREKQKSVLMLQEEIDSVERWVVLNTINDNALLHEADCA